MTRRVLYAVALLTAISPLSIAQENPVPSVPVPERPSQLEAVGLTPPTILSEGHTMASGEVLALDLVGRSIFASDTEDAEVIGTVEDLVIAPSGTVSSVILDVGNFIDTPGKSIAVDFDALLQVPGNDGETRWVLETTREALMLAPVFRRPDEAPTN